MSQETQEVRAYARYEWDCECGEINTEDHDPSGETVECAACGASAYVSETR